MLLTYDLGRNLLTLNAYIRKDQFHDLSLPLKKVEKEEQINPKLNRI